MTNMKARHSLLITTATLFLLYSLCAAEPEPYETVNKFCSQKNDTKDREFCMKALKSDPRSATAKDNVALLLVSDDLAIERTKKTREHLVSLYKKEGAKSKLKECIYAYRWGIRELKIIPEELKDDPGLASYDALMASDAMYSCKDSLEKHNVSDPYVLKRHRVDLAYVRHCVDISMTVG